MATDPVRYAGDNVPIGELLRRLIEDLGHLVRTELRLAQAEVRSNLGGFAGGALMVGVALVFFVAALVTLIAAFVGWLKLAGVPSGWAELIVAAACAVIGLALVLAGRKKISAQQLTPERTIASVKADAETIKGN